MCVDYLEIFCLSDFLTDKNNKNLNLDTLQATIFDLSFCLKHFVQTLME